MTEREALARFYGAIGLNAVDRTSAVFRALTTRFGREEAERFDVAVTKPEQLLRLEALFYETLEPSLAQARAALSGAYTPRQVPPIQQVPGAVQIATKQPAPPPQPSAPPGATGRAADPAWRTQREAELRRIQGDPRYFRDRDPAVIAEVEAGYRELYPGKSDASGGRAP